MSEENVEVAWRASRAWNEGGIDALLHYLDPGVEWHGSAEGMLPRAFHGHDGVRDYLERVGEVFDERRLEPLEVIDVDDERVISVTRIVGRSEKFGTELSADSAWLITFGTNRKAVHIEAFTDKAQALEAVGVGDVAGERRGCPPGLRSVQPDVRRRDP
jgi:ketosteroid isomerase-like protein